MKAIFLSFVFIAFLFLSSSSRQGCVFGATATPCSLCAMRANPGGIAASTDRPLAV
jgi:hypothetical protein